METMKGRGAQQHYGRSGFGQSTRLSKEVKPHYVRECGWSEISEFSRF